jgi:hypothetical protein
LFNTSTYTTVTILYSPEAAFNPDNVNLIRFAGISPSGGGNIDVKINSISASAIPEPSTYAALFGAAALGLAVYRKRRPAA